MTADPEGCAGRYALLTPPGRSALATLAVRGRCAWKAVRELFRRLDGSELPPAEEASPGEFWLSRLSSGPEEKVILALRGLRPEPCVELHCHGGPEVLRLIEQLLDGQRLRRMDWSSLGSGKDEACTELTALASAATARTAGIVLDQVQGAFRQELAALREALTRGRLADTSSRLKTLLRHAGVGRRLATPWRVVLAGAPNVGKSSLANALAGFVRSIVSATPGTTRDLVTTHLAFDGWPVHLTDTAGVRRGAGDLEGLAINEGLEAAGQADLCLWVVDASAPPVWPPGSLSRAKVVVNKIDLTPAWDLALAGDAALVSARTGEGVTDLAEAVARWLVPDPPAAGAPVPYAPQVCDCLESAWLSLQQGDVAQAKEALDQLV